MFRQALSFLARVAITACAFWLIFKTVEVEKLRLALVSASPRWLFLGIALFFLAQAACITRWRLLVPKHPAVTWPLLTDSFFVGSFFNTFLPTTVGGDVMRSFDLIKATGEWRQSLACVMMDRLVGLTALAVYACAAWAAFPPAQQDHVIRASFVGFCLTLLAAFGVLGSRRVLRASLRPFGRIGLGQLSSHANQLQESLRSYLHRPKALWGAFGISLGIQAASLGMFLAVSQALHLHIPALFLLLIVPIVVTVAQLPISLNGWGIREGATILLFGRIGIAADKALSLSLVSAAVPLLGGAIGGILFLARKRRRRRS